MATRGNTAKRSSRAELEFLSASVEETQAFGERLGRVLQAGDVVALHGELGTGKTTLIQGMARGMGRQEAIKSPTFVLMREYPPGPPPSLAGLSRRSPEGCREAGGDVPFVHIDGYRLEGAPMAPWIDLDLIFSPQKVTVIEWAERFGGLLPESHLAIQLAHVSTNRRRFLLVPSGERPGALVAELRAAESERPAQAVVQPQAAEAPMTGDDDDAPRD